MRDEAKAAAAGARREPRPKLRQSVKSNVKTRSLTSELRKNIQVGVAQYCGDPHRERLNQSGRSSSRNPDRTIQETELVMM